MEKDVTNTDNKILIPEVYLPENYGKGEAHK